MSDKIYRCVCGCTGIILTADKEDETISFAMYSVGATGYQHDWRTKLRHIWYILTKGNPWEDYLILDLKDSHELLNNLFEAVKEIEG